jgi:hypothetical protein
MVLAGNLLAVGSQRAEAEEHETKGKCEVRNAECGILLEFRLEPAATA